MEKYVIVLYVKKQIFLHKSKKFFVLIFKIRLKIFELHEIFLRRNNFLQMRK